jgi:hypothetical protein
MSSKPDLVSAYQISLLHIHLRVFPSPISFLCSFFGCQLDKFEITSTKNSCVYQYYIFLLILDCPSSGMNYTIPIKPLDMGPIRCPERSVKDYHSTLRNIPEERRSQDTHCTYKRIIEARWRNHCCHGKAISITGAKRMRCVIFSSVSCLVLPYFSTLSHKRHAFL